MYVMDVKGNKKLFSHLNIKMKTMDFLRIKNIKENLLFTPQNRGECISGSLNFKISWGGMPPDPPRKDTPEACLNGPSAHGTTYSLKISVSEKI